MSQRSRMGYRPTYQVADVSLYWTHIPRAARMELGPIMGWWVAVLRRRVWHIAPSGQVYTGREMG